MFFDHWGKPLFTLLSSPFAQFGFKGMLVFNICLFALTAIFLIKITKKLSLKYAWLAILFCFVSPVYFRIVLSGLTEILFATIIVVSLFLFLKRNFLIGSIILSFSILARPESYLVMPWFGLFLIYEKRAKLIPFFTTGFIIYSVVGFFSTNDIFWIITKRPYSQGDSSYGSGSFFHFVMNSDVTLGKALTLFFIFGVLALLFALFKNKLRVQKKEAHWLLLIFLPVISVVGAHSFLWWKGTQGSAGLLRVVAIVIPLASLIALYGINTGSVWFIDKFKFVHKKHFLFLFIVMGIFLTYRRVHKLEKDRRMIVTEKVLEKAAKWYNETNSSKKFYYIAPFFAYKAEIDPFNTNKGTFGEMKKFENKKTPSENMKTGELLLWESQFSGLEGGLSLFNLRNDKNLVQLISFTIEGEALAFFNGEKYKVSIFEKKNGPEHL